VITPPTRDVPTTMKAVGLYDFGGPEVLQVLELAAPALTPEQVLVRVSAVPVNPTDLTFRRGGRAAQLADLPRPLIPGFDFAGSVAALGRSASGRIAVGDPVVGLAAPLRTGRGSYATFVAADERSVVRAPAGVGLSAASTLLLNALTAQVALDALEVRPGALILVTGAAGAVGGYVAQMAHQAGYRVIALARPSDRQALASWGVDWIFDRGRESVSDVGAMFGSTIDAAVDAADLQDQLLPLIKPGGRIASLKGWMPQKPSPDVRVVSIVGTDSATNTDLLASLVERAARQEIDLRVGATLPFTAASDAHRLVEHGGTRGRIVLDFSDHA
jgi:NADPH2:quinone reductase